MSLLEENLALYRYLPLKKRMIIIGGTILLLALYMGSNSIPPLMDDLDVASSNVQSIKKQFLASKRKKNQLPRLTEELTSVKNEFSEYLAILPSDIAIDKILDRVALIARHTGIKIEAFDPEKSRPYGQEFKYVIIPINIEVLGNYGQIATFMDRVLNDKTLIKIHDLQLNPVLEDSGEKKDKDKDKENETQRQRRMRMRSKVRFAGKMIVYRALSSQEEKVVESAISEERKKKEEELKAAQPEGESSSDTES